jgi:hypothetical protein
MTDDVSDSDDSFSSTIILQREIGTSFEQLTAA